MYDEAIGHSEKKKEIISKNKTKTRKISIKLSFLTEDIPQYTSEPIINKKLI